jgi:hypothetical protein
MSETELVVSTGAIIALRLFDVAYAIDLARAQTLWAAQARASSRLRLTATPPKAMAFGVPPLALALDPVTLELDGQRVTAGVTVRLYDFGAISIALRVAVADTAWHGFMQRLNQVEHALASAAEVWGPLLAQVRAPLAAALERPEHSAAVEEDYSVGLVQAFDRSLTAEALLQQVDLVPLLSGEHRPLSEASRQGVLRQRFSYYDDDLVVLTWDRAFIYEPRGDTDVLDVIEVANAQFLEMRYYDELLDAELPRMYDLVEGARGTRGLLASRRFAELARGLHTLVAEVTELTERIDNALQVTEDVYLARIYAAALDLFRVRSISAAVDRKLSIIRDTYTALHDEASAQRAELLEVLIVLLIVVEVVLAVVPLLHR